MKALHAFIPTTKPVEAKIFYHEKLGLALLSDDHFALEFDAQGTSLRVTIVRSLTPHPFTVLGWDVEDITTSVRALMSNGITFERYEGLVQDDLGIWTAPSGTRVAWFKDPDGNVLSLSMHA